MTDRASQRTTIDQFEASIDRLARSLRVTGMIPENVVAIAYSRGSKLKGISWSLYYRDHNNIPKYLTGTSHGLDLAGAYSMRDALIRIEAVERVLSAVARRDALHA